MKNYKKNFITQKIIGGLVVLLIIIICTYYSSQRNKLIENIDGVINRDGYLNNKNSISSIKFIKIAGQSIKVDLALTDTKREQGLSARVVLAENNGMLFIFDRSGVYPFWMKDMNFPIDIIWLDENLKVVYIKKDARPESYPDVYGSEKKAKYVLEVSSGFSEKNNLKVGDGVDFTY